MKVFELAWTVLKTIFMSKKATATFAGVLFALMAPLFNKLGWSVTVDQVIQVVGVLAAFVVGQGLADIGKEAEKLKSPEEE